MQQKTLVSWLKAIIIIFGILLAALLFAVLPTAGIKVSGTMPEIAFLYWPCLIVSWLFGTPIFLMLMEAWKVCNRIASGQPFCADNARSFVSLCQNALIACGVLLAGNIGLIIVSAVTGLAVYPIAVPVFSMLVIFVGLAAAVACATLSHLIYKATDINEENQLTT